MKKLVDDWLNEVDYSFPGYTPSEETLKFINFIHLASEGMLENKTPTVHLKIADNLFKPGKRHKAILCHRGLGKSSLVEWLLLYIAAFGYCPGFGKVEFAIFIGDSIENGVKTLRKNIEYKYQNSTFLQKLIPNVKIKYNEDENSSNITAAGRQFTDVRMEFANVRGDRFVVKSFGVLTGIRGTRELGTRPTLAIADDIVSDEDARSETSIKQIENTMHKAVRYALSPTKNRIIWLGTPFNAKDPLYKVVESGAWDVSVYPVAEKFPCTREEFKGSWEDRFNYDYVKASYDESVATGQVESFNQELMLRIMSSEDRLIEDSDLIWFDKEDVLKNRYNFNFYITTDFATSEKKSSDYSVITVWAYSSNGDWLAVDGLCKQQTVDKTIDELFRYASLYNPLGVGIEVTGQQKGFVSWIQSEMIKRNIFFNLLSSQNNGEPGIRPVGDKFSRFHLFTPIFKQKKVWIANQLKGSEWGNEFEDEISKVGTKGFKSKHDDVLDTIAMLGTITAYKPSSYKSSDEDSLFHEDRFSRIKNTMF